MAEQHPPKPPAAIDARELHQNAEKIFEGPRFEARRVRIKTHSGKETVRDVVIPPDAVVVLPIFNDGMVGMIRNLRHTVGQTLWELPAGKLEADEDPAVAAGRELLEETGYRAKTLTELAWFYPSPGFCTEKLTAYRAEGLTFEGQKLEETENITVEPMGLDEALAMVRDGKVHDAKTIATLLYHSAFSY